MNILDLLRPVLPILAILPAILAGSRRAVVREFDRAGAYAPADAIRPARRQGIFGWWLARLAAAGVLHDAGQGRLWLDRDAWREYRRLRTRRAALVIAVCVGGTLIVALTSR